ncbi:hypothetical protein [Sphingorhabdus sp. Alg239-R122]|uniref:hypothetical protein n=1 Tax=Sphingorhabdus sp. Alg239-R122 TaxID=2305989 RepID=UPI0013DB9BC5|nr:hypothetical protein [Sphingorhabdus sp. Alg239-R122]
MSVYQANPAAGIFGKPSNLCNTAHKQGVSLPDSDEFEEDYTSYLKRLVAEAKRKKTAKA